MDILIKKNEQSGNEEKRKDNQNTLPFLSFPLNRRAWSQEMFKPKLYFQGQA